jgi:hypothetical protein
MGQIAPQNSLVGQVAPQNSLVGQVAPQNSLMGQIAPQTLMEEVWFGFPRCFQFLLT